MKRVVTALILIPLALWTIFWTPDWLFVVVAAAFAVLCYHEFSAILKGHGIDGPLWLGHAGLVLLLVGFEPVRLLVLLLLTVALAGLEVSRVVPFSSAVLLGALYTFGSWRCAIDLRAISPWWVLYALAINWAGDVAAFYVGRAIGRHKLAPRISPAKSWEGAIASTVAAIVFGLALRTQVNLGISFVEIVVLSAVTSAAGQVGDLVESAMKRGADMKDSSTLLPGHGGFLDRLDSSLFTLPVVYYYLHYRLM